MKKLQCEVCGSTEIKKISDSVFECQSCGVQYNATEVKKLLAEVGDQSSPTIESGTAHADQQNQAAFFIVEADVDPKENVRHFFEQLAATQNIACDIYKEIAIKSVTEKYVTFDFMKAKYRCDWSATVCHVYHENQTVYKEKYDYQLNRRIKEPVTEKVERVQRVPQSGSHIYNAEELVLASDHLSKLFTVENVNQTQELISAFESQQNEKYHTYRTKSLDLRTLQKSNGKYLYKGLEVNTDTDQRIYEDRSSKMAERAGEKAAPDITRSIGGDYYENLSAIQKVLSDSMVHVCIPVQIIEYTYKGKTYAAVSDLLSYTATMPLIYPCDTELAAAMGQLETQKEASHKEPGFHAGLLMMGLSLVCLVIGMLLNQAEIFIPLMMILGLGGMATMAVSVIIRRSREKKFRSHAGDIKRTLFDPRVEALDAAKKQFFEEYTDYASVQNAAANGPCLTIKHTKPVVAGSGVIRKKMAYVTNEVDSDSTIEVLDKGIKQLQTKRNIGIVSAFLIGALVGVLGIILLTEVYHLHTITKWILWILTIGSFAFAGIGSLVIMGIRNKRINHLRSARSAYKTRKQISEEYPDSQERLDTMNAPLSAWTEERITEEVSRITSETDGSISRKEKLRNWRKEHSVLLSTAGGLIFLAVLLIVIEIIVCSLQTKSYQQSMVGKIYEATSGWEYTATGTYSFGEDGHYEYNYVRIGMPGEDYWSYSRTGTYRFHYDLITGRYVFLLDSLECEAVVDENGKVLSFTETGDTFYEVPDRLSDSNSDDHSSNNNSSNNNSSNNNSSDDNTIPDSSIPTDESAPQSPASCSHHYTAATCTKAKTCTLCGATDGNALGHKYNANTECTAPKTCTVCGFFASGAEGHNWKDATCTSPKVCTVCGETSDAALGHSYTAATCATPKTCTRCGITEGSTLAHHYAPATCTKPKTCTLCGATDGNALGHKYNANTECTAPKTCAVCGFFASGAEGHNWKDATCTTSKVCTVCGETSGAALGHSYTAATCATPRTCTRCGITEGSTLAHHYAPATCTEPKTCTLCGATDGNALGHSYTAATCTSPKICSRCNTTSGAATGHTWTAVTETVHHPEQGHYEDETVATKVKKYQCWLCAYSGPKFDTLDAYYTHFDSAHANEPNRDFFRERYELVDDWVYSTETVWVVDLPAYSEKIIIGYVCDACGKEKEP